MAALSIRAKITEISGGERMEQAFCRILFRNLGCTWRGWAKIPENSVRFDQSCSGPVSLSLKAEFNMAELQPSKYNINALLSANDWDILLQHYCRRLR